MQVHGQNKIFSPGLSTSAWPNYGLDGLNITMHTEVVIHLMNAYCGVGAKSVANLMKFYLLQWEVMKVKFLINSNMTFA